MRKVLWMSRHKPTLSQVSALGEYFGEKIEVGQEAKPFDDARQIARRFREGGYDDMVVVAPLSVIDILCKQGIKPLWSEAAEENDPEKIEFKGARGQGFRFVRWRRILGIQIVFDDE